MNSYSAVLESYTIIEDPDLIAVEAFIYGAFESDTSSARKLKSNLNKLAKAKANNDKEEIQDAKDEVKESINELNDQAANEKDSKKKDKLKKIAKVGGIIAATIMTAATIHTVAKHIKNNQTSKKEILERHAANNKKIEELNAKTKEKLDELEKQKAEFAKGFSERHAKLDSELERITKIVNNPETDKLITENSQKLDELLKELQGLSE